jgi:methionyl-tRNA formyltransferase
MRVVSFGFQNWGFRTLRALIDLDHEVLLAVAHPASEQSYKAIWSAEDPERFVRALSDPYPRAFTFYRGEQVEVLEARVFEAGCGGTPGPGDCAGGGRRGGVGAQCRSGRQPGHGDHSRSFRGRSRVRRG